ncbi:MAG: redoxin domain-containing protein [Pirellulaceae bacterium]|nr:redoxin domain-containing protein [Pirellulaceae bacterium]
MHWILRTTTGRLTKVLLLPLAGLLAGSLTACNRAEPEKKASNPATTAADQQLAMSPADAGSVGSPSMPSVLPPANAIGDNAPASAAPVNTSPTAQTADPAIVPVASSQPAAEAATSVVQPGVHIEVTQPSIPSSGVDTSATNSETAQHLADRSFMKLKLPDSANGEQWIAFLNECDRAVQDLTIARQASQLNETEFLDQAKRLSNIKLQAAERLATTPDITLPQQKSAIAAQVESLSQLTGLGDVSAAQKLQRVAGQLAQSPDLQMAHQGKLVLLGFRLNQFQEGQVKDPQVLLDDIDQVMARPEDRGLVEFLALQQCAGVLTQLGYADQAKQVEQRLVRDYRESSDKDLAMRAWGVEAHNTAALVQFHETLKGITTGTETDSTRLAAAGSALTQALPSLNTLAYCARVVVDLEYSGHISAAKELGDIVANARQQMPSGTLSPDIEMAIDGHQRRLGSLGKPLVLEELVGFDGQSFDWSSYRNKVVLVCFWASYDIRSLDELNKLKELRKQIADQQFEIVGINVDDTLTMSSAEQMVSRSGFAWRTVRSSNASAMGMNAASAKAQGVNGYPYFALLVDRAGAVRAVHCTVDKLPTMITELLSQN